MTSRLLGALSACLLAFYTAITHAVLLPLESRLGGLAYYDPNLDATWLTDANFAKNSGFDPNGLMTWDEANAWAAGLSINGIGGWRLPSMDVNGDGIIVDCATATQAACRDNEYGFHFHHNGVTSASPGLFTGVRGDFYWSSTEYAPKPANTAWRFHFLDASYGAGGKGNNDVPWAVRSGDIGLVPVPAAVWLFGSGLIGLLTVARRRNA